MPMTDATLATPAVSASDTIITIGILHFTIGVRDHIAAAKFYSEVLGCRHLRSNERYSFMECGGSYFVLAKSQSEQSRRRRPSSCLHGSAAGIRSGARNHEGARRRTRQIFR
jgi:catechol-2,3-dioxygenase